VKPTELIGYCCCCCCSHYY